MQASILSGNVHSIDERYATGKMASNGEDCPLANMIHEPNGKSRMKMASRCGGNNGE
jgi:hypothetical protein